MKMPLGMPFLGTEEKDAVLQVIESRSIASGQTTEALEDALARRFNWKYCVRALLSSRMQQPLLA